MSILDYGLLIAFHYNCVFIGFCVIGFIIACLDQPTALIENTENADFDALVSGDERSMEFKRLMYRSPRIQENLRHLIPFYDQLGTFG